MPTLSPPPLPDFISPLLPFRRAVHVLQSGPYAGRRIHFIDQGDPAARPVVMLHGNPTWSFLWRKVIALLPDFRCVAPDLLGLGLSDRLPRIADHSLDRHGAAMAEVVEALDLRGVILVGQDWGGPVAAQIGARLPERIAGLVLANTAVTVPAHPKGTLFRPRSRTERPRLSRPRFPPERPFDDSGGQALDRGRGGPGLPVAVADLAGPGRASRPGPHGPEQSGPSEHPRPSPG
jgi:cis-3-alkyl-4-acyloxetan-2-one decarboxylase